MASKQDTEKGKRRFFSTLHDLDLDDDTEAVDVGQKESIAFLQAAKSSSKRPRTAPSGDQAGSSSVAVDMPTASIDGGRRLRRSESAPDPRMTAQAIDGSKSSNCATNQSSKVAAPKLSRSSSPVILNPTTRGTKRTRAAHPAVPEAQRIFKGLNFFFFPNNDTNVPRRQRIHKAVAYGATWIKTWDRDITHAVVDKTFTFDQLLEFIKLPSIPPNVLVVNETYPSDCLSYRCLLDPTQRAYLVPGQPQAAPALRDSEPIGETKQAMPKDVNPSSSLPLKPPGRAVLVREPETPSNTNESSAEHALALPDAALTSVSDVHTTQDVYNDCLEDEIRKAKDLKDLPIDLEDEQDSSRPTSRDGDGASDESGDEVPSSRTRSKPSFQSAFACMHKHDGSERDSLPNHHTIEILDKMADYYDGVKDEWRTRAYRKAMSVLRKQNHRITTKEEAMALPFIGERLATKIQEIALTSRLRRLESVSEDANGATLQLFTRIYGVGIAQASKWVEQGHKTLADLRAKVKLTPNQEIGLAHYDDFLSRIPRAEVKQLGDTVTQALHAIDPAIQVTIGGSYRRGSPDSGDVDLIITKPDAALPFLRTIVLEHLVPTLSKSGFLKCTLASTSKTAGSKWHGACALPPSSPDDHQPWRRIDLLLVPWDELGAALIYFTGNDVFNRSVRLLASKQGMRLNQHGLYRDVMRGPRRARVTEGTLVEGRSEGRIFEVLGVPWRPPEHRVC